MLDLGYTKITRLVKSSVRLMSDRIVSVPIQDKSTQLQFTICSFASLLYVFFCVVCSYAVWLTQFLSLVTSARSPKKTVLQLSAVRSSWWCSASFSWITVEILLERRFNYTKSWLKWFRLGYFFFNYLEVVVFVEHVSFTVLLHNKKVEKYCFQGFYLKQWNWNHLTLSSSH